jgi:glycerophosphoryl diester phosphodiesterase
MIALERRQGRPLCIGHRGAAALAPENTLQSFRVAVEAGVDLIEFDVLELATGELVVAHSNDLHEVSHGAASGTVRDRTLQGLREVAPALPTLDEALGFFRSEAPEVGVHVDLKTPESVEQVVASLQGFELVERTFVSSFHVDALRHVARLEPGLRTGVSFPRDRLGVSGLPGSSAAIRLGLRVLRPLTPALVGRELGRSGASALLLHHALVSERAVRRAHARGVPVIAWTVDDSRDLRRVDQAGVDAVVVNNPGLFVSTLEP